MNCLRYRQFFGSLVAAAFLGAAASGSAQAVSSVVNLSTRMVVQNGDNVLIGGFIISGTGAKKVVLRAIGPSLAVPGALADPTLELYDAGGRSIAVNDNWTTSRDAILATGLAPTKDQESAIVAVLDPGSYTTVVRGVNSTGVALVEIYDLSPEGSTSRIANISTRGAVLTGDNVMIGGFIVRGSVSKRMILRARGPSLYLSGVPIPGRLLDPTIELHDGNGALMSANDSWKSTQQAEIEASTLPLSDDREAALIATLPQGNYTAIVRGAGNTTGVALVEMYDLDQPPQADGSTLFISQLRAQGTTQSLGSGTATLRLSADETYAVITFDYTNLSSAVTGMHIHGPADPGQSGGILFDVDTTMPQANGSYVWVFAQTGANSVADIVAALKAGRTYFNIHTSSFPTGEISGFFNLSTGGQTAPVPTPPPALASGNPSAVDAERFLRQATFGATDALIAKVQSQGFDSFLSEQFAAPMSSHLAFVDAAVAALPAPSASPSATPNQPTITMTNDAWWTHAIAGPDQLRQRVAFALSEIFVISLNSAGLGNRPYALPTYYDVLVKNAFGNYRQLLQEITLNPAMGAYLNMLQNDKENPARGTLPNENYAREIMQLFSVGLYQLNLDGSLTLSASGLPIATYGQQEILGTAAVFTGWTYFQGTATPVFSAPQDWRRPMVNVASHHSTVAKTILSGVTLPANQTAALDLKMTLDAIFNHPNVGPFISRQLIQRLVTSNPSPGYVYRVASVFNNNGQGVRGDLQAVVRAILMDYDARGATRITQSAGKPREPVVKVTNLVRAYEGSAPDGKFPMRNAYASLAEEAMHSPTVFNFFSPDYQAPGAIATAGLRSPELEIQTETTAISTANYLRTGIYSYFGPSTNRITLNLTNEQTLATDPAKLVDHLDALLMASSMSPGMRSIMLNAVGQIPSDTSANRLERVRTAIYLGVNSPEFSVEK
ncbi:MAG: DUF1800 family protein [Verrucomicrobiota bacterium]|nr:DUF1800 family protein [Verrucomicrobiota bacterium]